MLLTVVYTPGFPPKPGSAVCNGLNACIAPSPAAPVLWSYKYPGGANNNNKEPGDKANRNKHWYPLDYASQSTNPSA